MSEKERARKIGKGIVSLSIEEIRRLEASGKFSVKEDPARGLLVLHRVGRFLQDRK